VSDTRKRKWSLPARLGVELAVIVVGVLLALWADGWVADRADRKEEASRVAALRENIVATRDRLNLALEQSVSVREALTSTAQWTEIRDMAGRAELVGNGLLYGPVFTPELNVYTDLKSSGDLALLRSTDLRQALARMDATFEQLALLQADITMVQQLTIDPFVIREFDLGPIVGPWVGLEDLPREPNNPDFDLRMMRNLSLFKLDLIEQEIQSYREAMEVLEEVDGAMAAYR
jgi:hypothetical protein